MKFSTKGIIIRQQNIGEQDRLVWILTDSHGVIRAFVRRARNIKSPKSASTGLLCYSKLSVYQGREAYGVDEAEAIEQFIGLRYDVENMALAQYFCELCIALCPKEAEAEEYLRLMLNSLFLLSQKKKPPELVKLCFQMRLITMCGYMPDLVMCPLCGKYEDSEMVFHTKTGQIYCSSCAENNRISGIRLPLPSVTALRHTVYADADKLFSFTLKDELLDSLGKAADDYIAAMTSRDFQTLHFYNEIRNT